MSFRLEWILATSIGWILLGIVDGVILLFYPDWVISPAIFISGISVGVAQWFVLRQKVKRASWWIWATSIGWATTWALLFGLGPIIGSVFFPDLNTVPNVKPNPIVIYLLLFLAVVVAPLGMGVAQWYVLKQSFHQAGWWILATVISFAVGMYVVVFIMEEVIEIVFVSFILFGVINALITGGVLGWILLKPQKAPR